MVSKPDELQSTLPGDFYLSDERFNDEVAAIFHREWFCAGREEGLEQKGAYRLVDIAGESVLIVRADDQQLNAFNNVCRHRGAELVSSTDLARSTGQFTGGIRCPYHSWHYRLSGELHSTPHINVDRSCLALHRVEVALWGGFVFLRVRPGVDSLLKTLDHIPERLQRYPLTELRTGHRIDYEVAANWKVILENYNECYHCAGVHPELCRIVPAFRAGGGSGLDWNDGIEQREGTDTFTFSGTTSRQPFPGLDETEKVRHKGELAYPNLMLSLSMDHVAAFTLQPKSPVRTHIRCEFLFYPDEMARPDFDPSDAVEFWDLVNRQDWAICESVQRGMRSRRFESGYYAPMEDYSLDIRDYVLNRLK